MPRTDVFNRNTDVFGGSFTSDSVRLTFPTVQGDRPGDVGLLIQNLDMSYQQQITRLYEIGTPAIFYIAGRTAGNGTMMRIMGPRQISQAFYQKYGDVCQAASNTIRLSANVGCGANSVATDPTGVGVNANPTGSVGFQAYFVVLQQLRVNLTAEQVVIGENLSYMFSSLDYDGNATAVDPTTT